jgi:hypothetical protein
MQTYDYLTVSAGSAGVLAARLTEDPGAGSSTPSAFQATSGRSCGHGVHRRGINPFSTSAVGGSAVDDPVGERPRLRRYAPPRPRERGSERGSMERCDDQDRDATFPVEVPIRRMKGVGSALQAARRAALRDWERGAIGLE